MTFINGSRLNEGTTYVTLFYLKTLANAGVNTKLIQLLDINDKTKFPKADIYVKGTNLFQGSRFSGAINRLILFPERLNFDMANTVFFSDPTLSKCIPPSKFSIMQVHDFRPFTYFNDSLSLSILFKILLKRIQNANVIIVPTKAVLKEALELDIPEDKLRVIPQLPFRISPNKDHITNTLYRLQNFKTLNCTFVSSDRPYKNINLFIKIAEFFSHDKSEFNIQFHLVSHLGTKNLNLLKKLNLPNLQIHSNIEDMDAFYEKMDILIYPSMYEGFGRPTVEAMSKGMPIIYNDTPAVNEIVGNAGIKLDSNYLEDWITAIKNFTDPLYVEKIGKLSFDRFNQYFTIGKIQKLIIETFGVT